MQNAHTFPRTVAPPHESSTETGSTVGRVTTRTPMVFWATPQAGKLSTFVPSFRRYTSVIHFL